MANSIICLICGKRKAQKHPTYGLLPCKVCQEYQTMKSGSSTQTTYEFVPQRIRDDRKAHQKDTIQPYRDGTLSKEYLEQYGTQGIKPTKDQVKNAKYTWTEDVYYKK